MVNPNALFIRLEKNDKKQNTMKWLTLKDIKAQCRIPTDFTEEDELLTGYGNSAESTILRNLNRTFYDLTEQYGAVNAQNHAWSDIINASKMLVDVWYQHRSPLDGLSMSIVPYTFDLLIKPYMKLAGSVGGDDYQTVTLGSDAKIEFTAELPDDLKLSDVEFAGKVINADDTDKVQSFTKADCIAVDEGNSYVVLVYTEPLGVGMLMLKLTVHIPDTDYPSGYRKQVVNINPYTIIKG